MKTKKKGSSSTGEPSVEDRGVRALPSSERRSTVAKVSHTLSVVLAERLEEFAFFQRISESAVIEYCLQEFFGQARDDAQLGDILRSAGAGRRRKS